MPLKKCEQCGSCWLKEQMCDANTKTADSFSKIRVLAAGVIKIPILVGIKQINMYGHLK